jgi:hypothetical protein
MTNDSKVDIFQLRHLIGHSGEALSWKVECDELTEEDWFCLATLAYRILPPFGLVEGVPRGGLRFAEALRRFSTAGCSALLIADDVCTTGASLEAQRDGRDAIGIVAFARSGCPSWVMPIWTVHAGIGK